MRFHIFAVGVLTVGMAHAEDIPVRADVTHATIYGGAAEVTRQASVTVPAGAHRLLVPVPQYMQDAGVVSAALSDGTPLGPVRTDPTPGFEDGQFDTPAQAALRARIEVLEAEIEEAEDQLAHIEAGLGTIALQRRYLESYASSGSGEVTAPDEIGAVLSVLGQQMEELTTELLEGEHQQDEQLATIAELQADLSDAEAELRALFPLGADSIALAIPIEVTEAADLAVNLTYLATGLGWHMTYTARLSTGDGALTLARTARLESYLPDRWEQVALTLSGEEWGQVLDMTGVRPSLARIEEERPPEIFQDRVAGGAFVEPVLEPVIITEESATFESFGLSFNAEIAEPQTLGQGGETLVPFDTLSFDAEITIEANPRRDDTAFLIARAENTTGQPLIPGDMAVYRDAAFLADEYMDTIPPGGEVELPFGSVDHLQLFWRDLSRNEGDEGFFNRSNVQRQVVEFGVTNVSDQPEDVRILYAVPYTEQDDLELDLTLSIAPSEENLDGRRGIHAWDLTVAPGETRTIRMEAEMSWPEGYDLYWRP
ncbi:mucoidy inhibitor MuiA family protein [Nioella aestuarii]|uniref:mucoidy inhibitor MuiA family protein n=1 Tax=Nioella aestuarii TaxID=1662864 RepID=UPI003D7F4D2C